MTDAAAHDGQPTAEQDALAAAAAAHAAAAPPPAAEPVGASAAASTLPEDRPELVVGAAFAGGLVLALLLKRLAR